MKKNVTVILGAAVLIAAVTTGCSSSSTDTIGGSGTGITGSSGGTTSRVAVGTMTKGSVIVNGVAFADGTAKITADDAPKTSSFPADGMTVKVKGTVNADGVTGVAANIEIVNEVRGAIESKGTDTATVNGQTVLVDGGTVLVNAADFGALARNDTIEVHGTRDAGGVILATRLEKLAGAVQTEVRGAVSGKTASTFIIGGRVFTYDGSTVMVPAGATFQNGDVIEARLNGNAATRIAVERLNHPEFEPAVGQVLSVEGILSGFTPTTTFSVGTRDAELGSGVTIEGGETTDLVDGMKVEAEGSVSAGGLLTAEKITLRENIRIEANAVSVGSAGVLGKTVATTSLTRLSGNLKSVATITTGDGLRIRGFVNSDGASITATGVDKLEGPVDAGKVVLQGPVREVDAAAQTFTIMDIMVNCGSSLARPNDDSGAETLEMTREGFFSILVDGKTVVKSLGTFSNGVLEATEIEIE